MKSNMKNSLRALMFLLVFFLRGNLMLNAQTSNQQISISMFFKDGDNRLLSGFAHPTCSVANVDVRYQDASTWFVGVTHVDGNVYFTCQYKIIIKDGYIVNLIPVSCGSKDVTCFDLCDLLRVVIAEMSNRDKDRFQRLWGKALDQLTCQQICLASLFYRWVDLGYYTRFTNGY